MATRMQQRRGTAAQWTAANPTLAAGEIGFETDNGRFKIGDGATAWSALDYFADQAAVVNSLIDGAPDLLNTLNELAEALGDDPAFFSNIASDLSSHALSTTLIHGIANTQLLATLSDVEAANTSASSALGLHEADTTLVHGIADTALLATLSDVEAASTSASAALGLHEAETTTVHGIADTSVLVTQQELADAVSTATVDQELLAGVGIDWNSVDSQFDIDSTIATKVYADDAVGTHNSATANVHGIVNTLELETQTGAQAKADNAVTTAGTEADSKVAAAVAALTKSSVGLTNVDNTSDADKPVSTATQTALNAKASLAGAVFTGSVEIDQNLTVDGNLTVSGTTTTVSTQDLVVTDPMIYLGEGNTGNLADLGFVANYNDGTYQHSGLVRDSSASKWKLFTGVTDEPTTTVNFAQGSLDALAVGALEATTVTPSAGVVFSDGTQTKEGTPSRTPIIQKSAGYTLSALSERDSLIEVSAAGVITIPTDATLNFPIGTSIDVLQTGTGTVSVAPVSVAVTVNATPGLTLRTQWSSATLLKRAANTWVVYGDLK